MTNISTHHMRKTTPVIEGARARFMWSRPPTMCSQVVCLSTPIWAVVCNVHQGTPCITVLCDRHASHGKTPGHVVETMSSGCVRNVVAGSEHQEWFRLEDTQ